MNVACSQTCTAPPSSSPQVDKYGQEKIDALPLRDAEAMYSDQQCMEALALIVKQRREAHQSRQEQKAAEKVRSNTHLPMPLGTTCEV